MERELKRREKEENEAENRECTFHPQLNPASFRVFRYSKFFFILFSIEIPLQTLQIELLLGKKIGKKDLARKESIDLIRKWKAALFIQKL